MLRRIASALFGGDVEEPSRPEEEEKEAEEEDWILVNFLGEPPLGPGPAITPPPTELWVRVQVRV